MAYIESYPLYSNPSGYLVPALVPKVIQVACSDTITAITTGLAKVTFRMPYPMTLTGARASVAGAPLGTNIWIGVRASGAQAFSTGIYIDAGKTTSVSSLTGVAISGSFFGDDYEVKVDFLQVGSTIAGTGVILSLLGI